MAESYTVSLTRTNISKLLAYPAASSLDELLKIIKDANLPADSKEQLYTALDEADAEQQRTEHWQTYKRTLAYVRPQTTGALVNSK